MADPDCGFVFATTGAGYTALAIRAAKTLKAVCPDYPIDLFTDQDVSDPVFDRVVAVEKVWHRPKIEALIRSRFSRTVYLDADLFVVADISDIFAVLDRFDLAAAHDQTPNSPPARLVWRRPLPAAFPQYNSGVLAVRRSRPVTRFLTAWLQGMHATGAERDQPILREMLFDCDLRIATLPGIYNAMSRSLLPSLNTLQGAPRVVHRAALHRHIGSDRPQIATLQELLGPQVYDHLQLLLAADHYLVPGNQAGYIRPLAKVAPVAAQLAKPVRKRPVSNAQRLYRWFSGERQR